LELFLLAFEPSEFRLDTFGLRENLALLVVALAGPFLMLGVPFLTLFLTFLLATLALAFSFFS